MTLALLRSQASFAGWPEFDIEGKHDIMEGTYVYLLQSLSVQDRRYVGLTRDLETRLEVHNNGVVESTWRHKPWKLVASICFSDRDRAEEFEIYLKHGSGHAFAKRHFW